MTFTDKVVAITGASSGIGRALALDALNRGAFVAVCARNLEKLKGSFPQHERLLLLAADVSKESDCNSFIEATIAQWGRVDVLINNAGSSMRALFQDLDLKVLRELMDVNYWGTVCTTKAALDSIIKHKGTIVGVSSIAGYRGLPGRTGYSSSKFAMQGFMESLRTELLYKDVNVMWVAPGFTASNIRNTALAADGSAQKETPLDESKLMSSETCARIILDGVEKRKRTIVMTGQGKLTVFLSKFLPGFLDKMVFNHFAKEPNSPLKR
ncbi:short chain dehydrogenase [Taibaiella sp. KBW10]|uniref:SDR family oxidoreductase n=1 Tax=Taibaiella sp. KBW10 TaxID=2153357 RepID=UPI000F5A6286|nr:SDR family oxidoreductase [Taibaiella sp. KBW10]RQO31398.1 short chain dehydrogenase [Taibaiella sp. KBW10]